MKSNKVKLIFISDLHFPLTDKDVDDKEHVIDSEEAKPYRFDRLFIDKYLNTIPLKEFVDIILVIGGDLVTGGKDKKIAYVEAEKFLKQCADKLEIPYTKVVIAPGNHDITRVESKSDQWKMFKQYTKDFCTPFSEKPYYVNDFVLVYPFNSVEIVKEHNNSKRKIFRRNNGVFREVPNVSNKQITHMENLVPIAKEQIKFACFHYHLLPVYGLDSRRHDVVINAAKMIQKFHENNFLFLLHGHKHRFAMKLITDLEVGNKPNPLCVLGTKPFSGEECNINEFTIVVKEKAEVLYKRLKIYNGQLQEDSAVEDLLRRFPKSNDSVAISHTFKTELKESDND